MVEDNNDAGFKKARLREDFHLLVNPDLYEPEKRIISLDLKHRYYCKVCAAHQKQRPGGHRCKKCHHFKAAHGGNIRNKYVHVCPTGSNINEEGMCTTFKICPTQFLDGHPDMIQQKKEQKKFCLPVSSLHTALEQRGLTGASEQFAGMQDLVRLAREDMKRVSQGPQIKEMYQSFLSPKKKDIEETKETKDEIGEAPPSPVVEIKKEQQAPKEIIIIDDD